MCMSLPCGGYACGTVARKSKCGTRMVLAMHMQKFDSVPDQIPCQLQQRLTSPQYFICSTAALKDGRWRVIEHFIDQDRGKWPLPLFANRYDGHLLVKYDEDTLQPASRCAVHENATTGYPEDGMYGVKAVESCVSQVLCGHDMSWRDGDDPLSPDWDSPNWRPFKPDETQSAT